MGLNFYNFQVAVPNLFMALEKTGMTWLRNTNDIITMYTTRFSIDFKIKPILRLVEKTTRRDYEN